MTTYVRLHRLGEHRQADFIEESCAVMDIMGEGGSVKTRIVIDCGLHPNQGAKRGEQCWLAPDLSFFNDDKKIDAVLITHAHTDHVGYAPALVPYLAPNASYWATKTTATILEHGFGDASNIAGRRMSVPPFSTEQIHQCLDRIKTFNHPGAGELPGTGLEFLVWPSGHVNGACSYTFKLNGRIIHYAGDRCTHDQPGIRGATPLPPEWKPSVIAGSDCTYGADHDSDSRSWEEEMQRCYDLVGETVRKGSIALLHAFAIHRGPSVAHELARRGINDPRIAVVGLDGSCVYYAGEQANVATGSWSELDSPLDMHGVCCVKGRLERNRLHFSRYDNSGLAVVTTSGMGGPGGPSSYWRQHVLGDPDAAALFTGFVAPGTDGDKILKAAEERDRTGKPVNVSFEVSDMMTGDIHTEVYPLRCHVAQLRLGGHDSREKTIGWFRDFNPEVAVLAHGSKEALASLEADLRSDIPTLVRSDEEKTVEITC